MLWPSRRNFLRLLVLTLSLLAGCENEPPRDARGYSLLLVSLDTVRADHLGAYGAQGVATPTLDGLAARGARFADVMANAPLTLPSHASLFTGLVPPRHGLRLNGQGALPSDIPTLAEHLTSAGYDCAAFVGAFVLDRRFGLARGFAHYDDAISRDEHGLAPRLEAERPAGQVVDRAAAWLRQRPKGGPKDGSAKPFFAWLHLYDAHAPYQPPPPFDSRFADSPYDGEIAYVDQELGRLLAVLDEQGLAGQTVIAILADHGESLGEYGEKTHGLLLYQGALGVPWLVTAPEVIAAGRVLTEPASLADVTPTLTGLLGQNWRPCGADQGCGRDLSDALRGQESAPSAEPPSLYAETEYPATFGWSPLAALRVGRLKLIASPRPELFDLAAAGEKVDRARDERRALRELESRLEALRAQVRGLASTTDAETLRQLAALGYVGGGKTPQLAIGDGAHPVDRLADYARWEELEKRLATGGDAADVAADVAKGLRLLVEADPGNPVFRTSLARLLRREGQVDAALPLYRQAVADAPSDPDAWQNLAAVLQEAGAFEAAAAAARQTLNLDPERPEALNLLGLAELEQGRLEEAAARFRAALTVDPANATAWNNLGNVLVATGQLDEAGEAYRRATELAPRYADPCSGIGALWIAKDRPREAIPWFLKALELDPAFEEARLNLGIAYHQAGDLAKARALYLDLLRRTHNQPRFAAQRQAASQLLTTF